MNMQLLTCEHIYLIHRNLIEDFGGDSSYYSNTNNKVESILAQQYPCFNYDKYPTVYLKAAMLMYFFIKGHCFVDGNKRVGLDVAVIFLTINGCIDYMESNESSRLEGYKRAIEIANLEIRNEEIDQYIFGLAEWLKNRFKL
jgi:death-on-curing protein